MNARRTLATSRRVLLQLRHDPRTIALMVVVPCLLMALLRYIYDGQPGVFERVGPVLLAIFPFIVMFVITSVAMLRERTSGTLELLLTKPLSKGELLTGYALAFGAAAVVQVAAAAALTLGPLGLDVHGSAGVLQFLPAFVLPQLLLSGLFAPRDQMGTVLRWLSDALPLSYAVDGATRAATSPGWTGSLVVDLVVVGACVPLALGLGAVTLHRRTP